MSRTDEPPALLSDSARAGPARTTPPPRADVAPSRPASPQPPGHGARERDAASPAGPALAGATLQARLVPSAGSVGGGAHGIFRQGGGAAAGEPPGVVSAAPEVTLRPEPVPGSHALTRVPIEVPLRVDSFTAARRLDIEPAVQPKAGNKTADATPTEDYRGLYADAGETAFALYRRLTEEASRIIDRWRDRDRALGDLHQSHLDLGLADLLDGVGQARSNLSDGRDWMLEKLAGEAEVMRGRIRDAASAALQALAARHADYERDLTGPRGRRSAIERQAEDYQTEIEEKSLKATESLETFAANPAAQIHEESVEGAADTAMLAAVHEAKLDYVPTRITTARSELESERVGIVSMLTRSFQCLPCEFDRAFQGLDARVHNVSVLGPRAVLAARAGGLRAVDDTADQLRAAIDASYTATDATLVKQHDRMRETTIRTAETNCAREHEGVAATAARQSEMLGIVAGAQSTALGKVHDWLATQSGQAPAAFARAASQAARQLRANLLGIGERQPRETIEARDRLDARMVATAEAFEAHQGDFSARTNGTFEELAAQSIQQLDQQIEESLGQLDHVPHDVRASCNAYLEPMGAAYADGLTALRDAVDATGRHVDEAFNGASSSPLLAAPAAGEPNMCSADDLASYAPPETTAPPPPASAGHGTPAPAPATCGTCHSGEEGAGAAATSSAAPGTSSPAVASAPLSLSLAPPQQSTMESVAPEDDRTPRGFANRCVEIGADPTKAPAVASFFSQVATRVPQVLSDKLKAIDASLAHFFSPDTGMLMGALRGLTAAQGAAISALYAQNHRLSLHDAIDLGYDNAVSAGSTIEANKEAAWAALDGDAAGAAMSELVAAFNYSNEDQRIRDVLLALTPMQLAELRRRNPGRLEELAQQLDGEDLVIYNQLIAGNTAYAEASALRHDVDEANEKEGDERGDALATAITTGSRASHGLDADPNRYAFDTFGFEEQSATRERNAARWTAVQAAFATLPGVVPEGQAPDSATPGSALFTYATRSIHHDVQSYGDPEGGGVEPDLSYDDTLDPRHRAWIDQMLRHGVDSTEARGAHLLVERRRTGGDPKLDGLDESIHVDDSDLAPGPDGRRPTAEERRGEIFLASERLRFELEGGTPPPTTAEGAQQAVASDLANSFTGDANARAIAMGIVGSNQGDPRAVIDYAIDHESTDLALRYLGRMNRDQIDDLVSSYNRDHPNGPSLYQRLGLFNNHWSIGNMNGAVFSGDKANALEIAFMGVPRNARERAEVALRVMDQQIEQSGALGRFLAGDEYAALSENAQQLREMMGVTEYDIDELGRIRTRDPVTGLHVQLGNFDRNGDFVAPPGGSQTRFETAIGMAHTVADGYTAATDRIASFVTTALMVVAAVVTTALTGGAAASIWIPMLVTAGAGLVGIGLTAAIKGGRYSRDEVVRDLAMTVVQAATAGIGAAAGTALRGGTAALKTLASGMRVSEEVLAAAAGSGGLRALTAFEEIAIGAGSGALSGGVGAAVDPEARHGDHYGMGILHGIFKGAIGGGAAAGVTRVVAGGINNLARGMGARSGARAALEAGASEEAALRMAALRSRAYGTSFVTEASSRALGAGAGGIASRGAEIAYDWRVRGQRLSGGQIAEELGGAFLQNATQGFLEASADRGMRAISPAREAEHAWTTRHDQDDYDARARRAVDGEMDRLGMPRSDPLPETGPVPHLPPRPTPPSADTRVPEATPLRPRLPEPEPLGIPRSAIDEQQGRGRVVEAANDNGPPGTAPARVRLALEHADMIEMGRIAEGSVFMHPESNSVTAANDNFGRMILADPTREVAIYHNPVTGEYIVIQGEHASVGAITPEGKLVWGASGENSSYAWQSLLNRRDGHWVLRTHYHPNAPGEHGAPLLLRLPSGRGGDFSVIEREVTTLGHESRSSRIYFNDGEHLGYTDFGYEPGREGGPLWVNFADPASGARVTKSFADFNEYHAFVGAVRRDPEAAMASAHSGPMPRSVEPAETPRALAAGSRETALTPADRATIADFHERIEIVSDHEGVLRSLTAAGASEQTITAARGWLADAQTDARSMAHAMGLVGESDSVARLHLVLNDRSLTVAARTAMAETVLEATRAHLIAGGELGPDEPLVMLYHGAPDERTRSLKSRGIRFEALGTGATDDFGRGLYLTRDLETAGLYTHTREGAMGLRPDEAPGEIYPFIVRGRDMGAVVDVGPDGVHRDAWEAFARAHYFEYEHLPNPEVDMAMIRGEPVPFGQLDGFGPRGELFDRFLGTLDPPFNEPSIVFGELGGPFTSGVGVGNQQAARREPLVDLLDSQMGFRREEPLVARSLMAEPPEAGDGAHPRALEPDEIDISFAATFGIPEISEKPVLSRDSFSEEERAAGARQVLEMQASIASAVHGFEGSADPEAAMLRGLRALAPAEMAEILLGGTDGSSGARRGLAASGITPQQREAVRAALAAKNLSPVAIEAHLSDLGHLLRPGGALRTALAHAAERAAWSGFAAALTPRVAGAIALALDEAGMASFANKRSKGSAGPDLRVLRGIDREATIVAIRGSGSIEERVAAYQSRRRAAGAPDADLADETARLLRVLADPGLDAAMNAAHAKFATRGATAGAIADLAQLNPELLALARTHPDYVLERYFSALDRAGARKAGQRTVADADFADQVARNQDAMVKPVVSEASAAASLVRRLRLRLLKADSLTRGMVNKGGIDIVGIAPRLPNEPPESRPRVVLIDDKALTTDNLNDVSAMTGRALAGNLRKAANEIEAQIEYNRRRGFEPEPEELSALAQMRAAASDLDAVHRDPAIGKATKGGGGKGRAVPRERSDAYAAAVAEALSRHNISMLITSEIGSVTQMAAWLRRYNFMFIREYRRLLEKIDKELAKRGAASR